jgi:6,7-dimethyl-8-ribityllumazine synthase
VVHNVALILGQFHKKEAQEMKDEAMRTAEEHDLSVVEVAWIPGSMEAPLAAKRLLQRDDIHGIVVLGIIERGETDHGVVMGHAVIKALIDLQVSFMKPIGMGILGPGIFASQISPRLRSYARAATLAVCQMLRQQ